MQRPILLPMVILLSTTLWLEPVYAGIFSVSEADEIAIGRAAVVQVEQKVTLLQDRQVQRYISRLGHELAARSGRPNLPWRFRVIRDNNINAFALPGGFIYIHSKVLETVGSEAELASVLAHEIGHIEGYHHRSQIERAKRYQLGLGVLGAVLGRGGGADYAMLAGNLLAQGQLTRYSRQSEADADRRGVLLLQRTGFNPMAMSRFLQHLVKLERGNSGILSSFFADHPDAASRVAVTRNQARLLPQRLWRRDSRAFRLISGRASRSGFRIEQRPQSSHGGLRIPSRSGQGHDSRGQDREGARIIP
ncbi:MAG: M48 family metallopeptidase [Mariprofundus sp.]|nr:M48 family metallopeptidase [Mariprofundus sp.]